MKAGPHYVVCALTRQGDDMIMVVLDPSPWQRRDVEERRVARAVPCVHCAGHRRYVTYRGEALHRIL